MGHPLGYTHIYIYIYLSIYLFLFLWGRRIWIRNCAWSFWNAITYSKLRLQLSPIGRHCKWCRWHRLDICNHIGATWSQAILRRNSPSCFVFDKRPQTKKGNQSWHGSWCDWTKGQHSWPSQDQNCGRCPRREPQPRSSIRPLHGQELEIGKWDLDKIAMGIAK